MFCMRLATAQAIDPILYACFDLVVLSGYYCSKSTRHGTV